MTSLAQPAQNGFYRIKLVTQAVPQQLYLQLNDKAVVLRELDKDNKKQSWNIESQPGGTWKITSGETSETLALVSRRVQLINGDSTTWKFEVRDGTSIIIWSTDSTTALITRDNTNIGTRHKDQDPDGKFFVFELISGGTIPPPPPLTGNPTFQNRFFTLDPAVAANDKYDLIIIGTGIGGGVLAADLFDTNSKIGYQARKVLVIEKGDLVFHSHCLNASRPSGLGEDRGQQNDTFFAAFKKDFAGALESAGGDKEWKGGPMYCLGGRSAAWGLFAPRVHDKTLREFFPAKVVQALLDEYYEKAEKLMKLSLPVTKPYHQHLIDRLNMEADDGAKVQWQWGRIASEFSDPSNFDFAEGAYSTIDKLLEIAMSKPKEKVGDKFVEREHENFKILLGMEGREIIWGTGGLSDTAVGVRARSVGPNGKDYTFNLKPREEGKLTPAVVVAAGSVNSAAILLRSGVPIRENGGCRVTDHDIYFRSASFRYNDPADRKTVGAMKLQTYANIGDRSDVALVNMSIDASTFLPRTKSPYDDLVQFIMVFIMRAPLWKGNNIQLKDDEPFVTIKRAQHDNSSRAFKEDTMKTLTLQSMKAIGAVLKGTFLPPLKPEPPTKPYFGKLQLGGVAHELGTVPMQHLVDSNGDVASWVDKDLNPVDQSKAGLKVVGCLDEDLRLLNYKNAYVCDLSIFPYSPEANPTPTLVALSLRLSRTLAPRLTIAVIKGSNLLYVVNHSGKEVKVFVSNRANVKPPTGASPTLDNNENPLNVTYADKNEAVILGEGRSRTWKRTTGVSESVSVFRIDPRWTKEQAQEGTWVGDKFWDVPELLIAQPEQVLAIL